MLNRCCLSLLLLRWWFLVYSYLGHWRWTEQIYCKIMLEQEKRVLEKTSTPLYNLLRKVIGCKIRLPSAKKWITRIASSTLDGLGCYFFLLLWLSMYDSAANITSNKVKTSIVFIMGIPLLRKTRGHLTSENHILLSVRLYILIMS